MPTFCTKSEFPEQNALAFLLEFQKRDLLLKDTIGKLIENFFAHEKVHWLVFFSNKSFALFERESIKSYSGNTLIRSDCSEGSVEMVLLRTVANSDGGKSMQITELIQRNSVSS